MLAESYKPVVILGQPDEYIFNLIKSNKRLFVLLHIFNNRPPLFELDKAHQLLNSLPNVLILNGSTSYCSTAPLDKSIHTLILNNCVNPNHHINEWADKVSETIIVKGDNDNVMEFIERFGFSGKDGVYSRGSSR